MLQVAACSAAGPPLPEPADRQPWPMSGSLFFKPPQNLFFHLNLGELTLKPIRRRGTGPLLRTDFQLRILGQQRDGSVRVRSWQGNAWMRPEQPGIVELAGERCYLFGKRYWEDKLQPLERWQCDQLVLQYRLRQTAMGLELQSIQTERTRYSDWFGPHRIHSIPGRQAGSQVFGGWLIPRHFLIQQQRQITTKSGVALAPLDNAVQSKMERCGAIVWGYQAGLRVPVGRQLQRLNAEGHKQADLRIISNPGDFLLIDKDSPVDDRLEFAWTDRNLRPAVNFFE
ncbi:MAG: hypothetical protein KDK39_12750 [Leptospiraceae bacterium]|nr:hypothetical protein [Leptospiraceae bacterium]